MGVELTGGSTPFGAEFRTSNGLVNPSGCWYLRDVNMVNLSRFHSLVEFFEEAIRYIDEHSDLEETMVAVASKIKIVKGYSENWYAYGYSRKSIRFDVQDFKPSLTQSGFLDADKFSIEEMELTNSDFLNVVIYLLTNTNLERDDVRLDFVRRYNQNLPDPEFGKSWQQAVQEILREKSVDAAQFTNRKVNLIAIAGGLIAATTLAGFLCLLNTRFLIVAPCSCLVFFCIIWSVKNRFAAKNTGDLESKRAIPQDGHYPDSYVLSVLVPPSLDIARHASELDQIHLTVKASLEKFGFRLIAVRIELGNLDCIIDAFSSRLRVSEEGLIYPKENHRIPFLESTELLDVEFFLPKLAQFCCRLVPILFEEFQRLAGQTRPTIALAHLSDVTTSWREDGCEMEAIWKNDHFDVFNHIDIESKDYESFIQATSEVCHRGNDLALQIFSIRKKEWSAIPIHPRFDDPNLDLINRAFGEATLEVAT